MVMMYLNCVKVILPALFFWSDVTILSPHDLEIKISFNTFLFSNVIITEDQDQHAALLLFSDLTYPKEKI